MRLLSAFLLLVSVTAQAGGNRWDKAIQAGINGQPLPAEGRQPSETKEGKPCTYDLSCGMGYSCHVPQGQMRGTCIKD